MEHLILFMLTIVHQRSSSYHVFKFNGSISSSPSPSYATLSSKVVVELPDQLVVCTSSQQARLADYLKLQASHIWKCQDWQPANLHNSWERWQTMVQSSILALPKTCPSKSLNLQLNDRCPVYIYDIYHINSEINFHSNLVQLWALWDSKWLLLGDISSPRLQYW